MKTLDKFLAQSAVRRLSISLTLALALSLPLLHLELLPLEWCVSSPSLAAK